MWLKVFGIVCAGVFVGAAYREVTEHRRRRAQPCCQHHDKCKHGSGRTAEEGDGDASRKS